MPVIVFAQDEWSPKPGVAQDTWFYCTLFFKNQSGHTECQLRRFALRFIHSHSDATGVFRNAFREVVSLTTSGNRVRHIVTSQDDAVAGLLGR